MIRLENYCVDTGEIQDNGYGTEGRKTVSYWSRQDDSLQSS